MSAWIMLSSWRGMLVFAFVFFVSISARAEATNLTSLANLFIGTASGANGGSGGNAFPGAAVPHAMAKVGIDVSTAPRQAGYISDNSSITGISLMHDEGTGGNTNGGYGIFPLFPLKNCTFESCPVGIGARAALRAAGADAATPGYFTTKFVNNIQIETTSTRRAGLIRFTFPDSEQNHIVVDLAHDLGRSFSGGSIAITSDGRVELSGSYGTDNYTAYACYDFTPPSSLSPQPIVKFGTFKSDSVSNTSSITVTPSDNSSISLSFPFTSSVSKIEAGGLLSFNASSITARFGVSFISSSQACANAEEEVPDWDFDGIREASRSSWETVLERVLVDVEKENTTVVELLYSSLYRASLVPANMTGENPYWTSESPFFDALFCSWDTFRTVHPLLSILSPVEWGGIVSSYVDGWRHTGYIPECRANTKNGYVQGGSDGMPILGDFAVKYGSRAQDLGVSTDSLYQALVDTAENTPPDWYRGDLCFLLFSVHADRNASTVGRQNTAWKTFGYIPTDWDDPSGSTGLATREASRAYEYALGDFAVRQAALALGKSSEDVALYANRSMNFVNMWDPNVTSDGFSGFAQRRFPNGTFALSPPDACSPVDPTPHSCARGDDNDTGFYESSSWEMSFFAPHSVATLIRLMGGTDTFINRVNHYFDKPYFQAGNEPSFNIPWIYHYANRPDLSVLRVRQVVFKSFNTGIGGIPGNDDSGAMASLLVFHLLGLYPVVASKQFLIGSPFVSSFTLVNDFLGTQTRFIVNGFDEATVTANPPNGSRLFVKSVVINGVQSDSLCVIDFDDVIGGGEIVLEVDGDAEAAQTRGCGSTGLPDSLETGGFAG
ncbi:hypothetical protein D9758_008976 [Tetrapyrgos nigripes]|uniref:Glycoside hydrolase family 92 protein n=1 Tax=Tetrapyrgos nigripes TaxID=182062 RepID=A0A8H5GKH4_9AGAR|nr:hypothetical protein D9758_008976 [Tetrapyrgos nigripes]